MSWLSSHGAIWKRSPQALISCGCAFFFLPPSQTEVMNGAKTNTLFRACSTECGNPVKLC